MEAIDDDGITAHDSLSLSLDYRDFRDFRVQEFFSLSRLSFGSLPPTFCFCFFGMPRSVVFRGCGWFAGACTPGLRGFPLYT
jgi:hypothetical protein